MISVLSCILSSIYASVLRLTLCTGALDGDYLEHCWPPGRCMNGVCLSESGYIYIRHNQADVLPDSHADAHALDNWLRPLKTCRAIRGATTIHPVQIIDHTLGCRVDGQLIEPER